MCLAKIRPCNRLQERAAEIFEKEAALFVPTGSMGNEIAVKLHTKPGQEIVIEERGHVLNYELGAAAVISGVTIRPREERRRLGSSDMGRDRARASHRPAVLGHADRTYLPREHAQLRGRQRDDRESVCRRLRKGSRRLVCRSTWTVRGSSTRRSRPGRRSRI